MGLPHRARRHTTKPTSDVDHAAGAFVVRGPDSTAPAISARALERFEGLCIRSHDGYPDESWACSRQTQGANGRQKPSNVNMKTLRALLLVGLAVIVAAASIGYSVRTTAHVRELERRLQHAEALLQSINQTLASPASANRIRSLEDRVQRAELAVSQGQPVVAGSGTPGLEQRVQNVERQIKPHLEVLPPYVPDK